MATSAISKAINENERVSQASHLRHLQETTAGCYVDNLHQARSTTLDIPKPPLYIKIAGRIAGIAGTY
jgi:hypothetical protein